MDLKKVVQDIKPPANKPESAQSTELIKAETGQSIPVKAQDQPSGNVVAKNVANPIASKQFVGGGNDKSDKELDSVLKDVNENVKKSGSKSSKQTLFKKIFRKKDSSQAAKVKKEPQHTKPILAIVAAFIVAAGLSVLAFHVYSQDQNPALNSAQKTLAASKTALNNKIQNPVKPADLSDLSLLMNSKLNGLNDTQDFNTNDLSDKNLGL
jgi:hypothetical protein